MLGKLPSGVCVINKILPAYQGRHSSLPEHPIFVVFLRVGTLHPAFLPRITRSGRRANASCERVVAAALNFVIFVWTGEKESLEFD